MDRDDEGAKFHTVGNDDGRATWFAGALMVHKEGADATAGRLDLLEQHMPPGYRVPRHVHRNEDEAWYVLEGTMIFHCGDEVVAVRPGGWVFAPRQVAHAFQVGPEGGRALTFAFPSGFAAFVDALGEPAASRTIPAAGPIDEARLAEVAAAHGIDIVGPPPGHGPD